MAAVIGLLLIILRVSHGVETYCDGRQDGAQCYGAFGGTVVLKLMDRTSEIFKLTKKGKEILNVIGNEIITNLIGNRSLYTHRDGIFRINSLSSSDGGEYTRTLYDLNGVLLEQQTLQLIIQGVETDCDGRQDGAQCYGALGGTVVLKLMDKAPEIYKLTKKGDEILDERENKIFTNLMENRSLFTFSDGTFRINNLSRADGGEYTLRVYDSAGELSEQRTLQLTIQTPVSSVLMVSECLSQGELRVSCSSEGGGSPQYSWTLDGQTLTDTQLLSGNTESNTITLRQDVSGRLVCSVRNNVNEILKEEKISTCGFIFIECISNGTHISQWVFEANNTLCIPTKTTTITEGKETSVKPSTNITSSNEIVTSSSTDDPWHINHSFLILGLRAAVVILILIGIFVYFAWKKKKYEGFEESAVSGKMKRQENSVMMAEMRNSASEL